MLQGIEANPIIVGAYTSTEGICPMLAAHRAGGRTSLIAFAEAWDRLAFRGVRRPAARRATERELLILRAHLEASLLEDEGPAVNLAEARREHEALRVRPGDPDRARELARRPGWAWSGIVRRYDDYERLLRRVRDARDAEPAQAAEPTRAAQPAQAAETARARR